MSKPVSEPLWGGPLDGGRITPMHGDTFLVRFNTMLDSRDDTRYNVVCETGTYVARYKRVGEWLMHAPERKGGAK